MKRTKGRGRATLSSPLFLPSSLARTLFPSECAARVPSEWSHLGVGRVNAIEHANCRRISCLGCVSRISASCATCRGSESSVKRGARVPRPTHSFPVWTFRMGSVMGGQCCRFPTIWGGAPPFALLSPIVLYFNFSPQFKCQSLTAKRREVNTFCLFAMS